MSPQTFHSRRRAVRDGSPTAALQPFKTKGHSLSLLRELLEWGSGHTALLSHLALLPQTHFRRQLFLSSGSQSLQLLSGAGGHASPSSCPGRGVNKSFSQGICDSPPILLQVLGTEPVLSLGPHLPHQTQASPYNTLLKTQKGHTC